MHNLKQSKFILFSILISLLFIQCNSPAKYSDYNSHTAMQVKVKGSSRTTLDKVQKMFNDKDYLQANTHLSRLAEYYIDNVEIQFYYGITFLETNQYAMAEMTFTKIANGNSPFKHKAQWYLALNALKQNDLEKCKTYLEEIPEDTEVSKNATELLEKIHL